MTEIEKVTLKRDIHKIAEYYGLKQLDKTIEELNELIEAISERDAQHMIEEIADVEIMTAQLKMLLDAEEDVERMKRFKVDRQLRRMEE